MSLHFVTVATKNHPVLDQLKEKVGGDRLDILGLERNCTIGWEAHGNLGLKLKLMRDYVFSLDVNDVVLFIDAYDVFFTGKSDDILERFDSFEKPIVFGSETSCSPDGSLGEKYPPSSTEFRFLNSGLTIGKVWALRECFKDYVYVDEINDQLWWSHKFLERQDLIELDYNNRIFLNCYSLNRHDISVSDDQIISYKGRHPLFLHFNGTAKAIMNFYTKIEPNPYFLFSGATEDTLRTYGQL
jgi:hypothetical protein